MKRLILSCWIVVSLIACEPGDFVDLPRSPRRIVILGFNEPGLPWTVTIGPTDDLNIYRYSVLGIPDAKVTLYEDGKFLEVLTLDTFDPRTTQQNPPPPPEPLEFRPSVFRSETNYPRPGHEYKVVVEAENFPTATATYVQPLQVEADITFEFRERKFQPVHVTFSDGTSRIDTSYNTLFDVSMTFTDPDGKNFYDFWQVQTEKESHSESKYLSQWNLYPQSGEGVTVEGGSSMIDDQLISGKTVNYKFVTSFNEYAGLTFRWPTPEWFTIALRTTNEEMYKYRIQIGRSTMAEYDPYSQPVRTYTNVENGLGIFGGFTPYSKQFHYKRVD